MSLGIATEEQLSSIFSLLKRILLQLVKKKRNAINHLFIGYAHI